MNKKGFLKILEAIIAIVIVFSFVIAVLPERPSLQATLPPDLEQTTNAILKQMQENSEFRQCVFGGSTTSDFGSGTEDVSGLQCIYEYVQFITQPKAAHPWNYGIRVCTIDADESLSVCEYYAEEGDTTQTEFNEDVLPKDKNIYIRSVTLTVPDVSSGISEGDSSAIPSTIHTLTVFSWSKY